MKYLYQILYTVIAFITFADASVIINMFDKDVRYNLAKGSFELDAINSNNIDSCNPASCSLSCHIMGFHNGICKDDICECIYRPKQRDTSKLQKIGDCSPLECDQLCRRIGFPGGACVNDRCKCDILSQVIEYLSSSVY